MLNTEIIYTGCYYEEVTSLNNQPWWDSKLNLSRHHANTVTIQPRTYDKFSKNVNIFIVTKNWENKKNVKKKNVQKYEGKSL